MEIGEYIIAPLANETDAELLAIKSDSHGSKGWTHTLSGPSTFTVTKVYTEGSVTVRKRIFEIR